MSDDNNIFLATSESVLDVARWVANKLSLALVAEEAEIRLMRLRGSARSADGDIVLTVSSNGYVSVDSAEEVQAIDRYPVDIDVWYAGERDEDVQALEARLVFDELIDARSEVPMLLSHNLSTLTAAHLPGTGTQYFDPPPSLDEPDLDQWRQWVVR